MGFNRKQINFIKRPRTLSTISLLGFFILLFNLGVFDLGKSLYPAHAQDAPTPIDAPLPMSGPRSESNGFAKSGSHSYQRHPDPAQANQEAVSQGQVYQGEVFKIHRFASAFGSRENAHGNLHAVLAGREARFFTQPDGSLLALVPVSVFEKPGVYALNIEDSSNHILDTQPVDIEDAHYRTQNVTVSKTTEGLQPLPGELEAIQALKDRVSSVRYWKEPFISPTPDCQNSPFGVKRYHNGVPTGDYHKGVDLRSPFGRPIRAITNGEVEIARMYRLHGGTVGIDHGQGMSSIYIHMSRLNVQPGQQVHQGDIIGYVGATGFATGPHLHWGMYVSGLPVNPNQWILHVPVCN